MRCQCNNHLCINQKEGPHPLQFWPLHHQKLSMYLVFFFLFLALVAFSRAYSPPGELSGGKHFTSICQRIFVILEHAICDAQQLSSLVIYTILCEDISQGSSYLTQANFFEISRILYLNMFKIVMEES